MAVLADLALKPVLNWANCYFAELSSDSSTNYTSFLLIELGQTFSSPNFSTNYTSFLN